MWIANSHQIISTPNRSSCRREFEGQYIGMEEQDGSSQFSQTQQQKRIDLQEYLEKSCKLLPVFGFNNAGCDILLEFFADSPGF